MSLYRTPAKLDTDMDSSPETQAAGPAQGSDESPPTTARLDTVQDSTSSSEVGTTKGQKRIKEAKELVANAKLYLSYSGNIRRDVKSTVINALDQLLILVTEGAATEHGAYPKQMGTQRTARKEQSSDSQLIERLMEEQMEQIKCTKEEVKKLREEVESQRDEEDKELNKRYRRRLLEEVLTNQDIANRTESAIKEIRIQKEKKSYAKAAVAAAASETKKSTEPPGHTTYHSIVVTSQDDLETGDAILNRIRDVLNAKEEGTQVDRIRKAKNRKVILSCRTEEGRDLIREKLKESEQFIVDYAINRDPLVVLKDVLQHNTDEEIVEALRRQNKQLFVGMDPDEDRMMVAYRKRARNPHTCSVVVRVSPWIWQSFTRAGAVHLDLQRVRVADQSPLVQCSLCLGYGHGKRLCKEKIPICSHCAGPHLKTECADWMAGEPPTCCNCLKTKQTKADHSAFAEECPVRRRWDGLARASVAYC